MQIESKIINSKEELLNVIKKGKNPLGYVKEETDIDFISHTLIIEGKDEDPYFEEMAEIAFKSIIYYVLYTENEEKTIQRCVQIAKMDRENIINLISKEERANVLFKAIEIASDRTAKEVLEKLNERLSKL